MAYDKIMQRLSDNRPIIDLQILDNGASAEYKQAITKKWNTNYQLVPPNIHCSKADECSICKFMSHFLYIITGVAPDISINLWDL